MVRASRIDVSEFTTFGRMYMGIFVFIMQFKPVFESL
jgi:hypothetical protein